MYVLIGEGYTVDHNDNLEFEDNQYESRLAVFDFEGSAEKYAEEVRLKQRKRISFGPDRVFRQDSLLGPYETYRVEYERRTSLPLNPTYMYRQYKNAK